MEKSMNHFTKISLVSYAIVAAYVVGSLAVTVGVIVLTIYLCKWILL